MKELSACSTALSTLAHMPRCVVLTLLPACFLPVSCRLCIACEGARVAGCCLQAYLEGNEEIIRDHCTAEMIERLTGIIKVQKAQVCHNNVVTGFWNQGTINLEHVVVLITWKVAVHGRLRLAVLVTASEGPCAALRSAVVLP